MGPNGRFPSLFVFGVLPSFLCPNTGTPNQIKRIAAPGTAKAEKGKFSCRNANQKSIKSKTSITTKFLINPGDLKIWSQDVTQAYIQVHDLTRDVKG